VIFYFDQGDDLHAAAKNIFTYLRAMKYDVNYLINLDTGGNNVYKIDAPLRACWRELPEGTTAATNSSNVLRFRYRKSF